MIARHQGLARGQLREECQALLETSCGAYVPGQHQHIGRIATQELDHLAGGSVSPLMGAPVKVGGKCQAKTGAHEPIPYENRSPDRELSDKVALVFVTLLSVVPV